jgi:hypothetical protein
MNQNLTKQNTISAEIVLDCFDHQSDRNRTACMVQPKTYWETTMLVAIGKGIELDVDVTKLSREVTEHVMRIGFRNILMDSHASVTAKADPTNYVQRSKELAEKKLASMYAGVVRLATVGAPKAPTDPVGMVILRLARKAVMKDKAAEITAASKGERLALINRLAAAYAAEHDAKLRPRAMKIVVLENDEAEPVKKAEPVKPATKKTAA